MQQVEDGIEQPGQDGLGQVAGGQRGDRDTQLRAGQLEGQRAMRFRDVLVAAVTGAGVRVDGAAFQGGQRELGGDEQRRPEGQHDDRQQAQRGVHDGHERVGGQPGHMPGRLEEGSASASSAGRSPPGSPIRGYLDGCLRHRFPFLGGEQNKSLC